MKCPNCGKEIADNTTRCYFCDYVIQETAQEEEVYVEPEVVEGANRYQEQPIFVEVKPIKRKFNWGSFFLGLVSGLFMSGFAFLIMMLFFGRKEFLIGTLIGIVLEIVLIVLLSIFLPEAMFVFFSLFKGVL